MLSDDTVVDPLHDRQQVGVVDVENIIHRLVESGFLVICHIARLILGALVIESSPGA